MSFPVLQTVEVGETRDAKRAGWVNRQWTFVVFSVSFIVLVILLRNQITDASPFETGDAAANSLLVREAKNLRLTVGNYSRVGFNHPGPILLYVLAAGEVLFYDFLHVARSPFGGQLLGLATWNAALLSLIFKQLRRSASHRTAAALFSMTVFLLAKLEPSAFSGNWFPYVYILPFVLFVVSVAAVQTQPTQSTRQHLLLGFATGVLWHAHVAFIPITLIVVMLMILQLLLRDGLKLFWVQRSRSLIAAAGIVCVFQVPLLIELSHRWPSPVSDYLTFGSENPNNSLIDALRFTVSFWPITRGLTGIVWIIGLVVLLTLARGMHTLGHMLIWVTLTSSAAVWFYAVVGVDDLHFRYVALFYRAAVSLGMAGATVTVAELVRQLRATTESKRSFLQFRSVVSTVSATAVILALTLLWRKSPLPVTPDQSLAADARRFADLTAENGAQLHADIDNWGFVWPRLAGLQVDAARHGLSRSCIATRWHILFTVDAKCQLSDRTRPNIRVEAALDNAGKPTHLNFVPFDLRLRSGTAFVPGAKGAADAAMILGKGWGDLESGRIWSQGQTASLEFSLTPGKQAELEFDLESLIGGTQAEVRAEVFVNGVLADKWVFNSRQNRGIRKLSVPSTESGRSTVEFAANPQTSAFELGLGPDRRKVGIAVLRVDVRSVHNRA